MKATLAAALTSLASSGCSSTVLTHPVKHGAATLLLPGLLLRLHAPPSCPLLMSLLPVLPALPAALLNRAPRMQGVAWGSEEAVVLLGGGGISGSGMPAADNAALYTASRAC